MMPVSEKTYRHVMDWDRKGRKGQRCEILRTHGGKCQVEFMDGTLMVFDRRALRKATPSEISSERPDSFRNILMTEPTNH